MRLNAVSPDGSSAVLTHGIANLTHRASPAGPAPLEPGRAYDVTVPLQSLGQAVEAGQRLRLALATCFWPWLWPSPEQATLTVHAGRRIVARAAALDGGRERRTGSSTAVGAAASA